MSAYGGDLFESLVFIYQERENIIDVCRRLVGFITRAEEHKAMCGKHKTEIFVFILVI